jgi:hypothetical protein
MSKLLESLLLILALSTPLTLHADDKTVAEETTRPHLELYYVNDAGLLGTLSNEPCDMNPIPPGIKAYEAKSQHPDGGTTYGCWLWETDGYGILVYWQDKDNTALAIPDPSILKKEKPALPGNGTAPNAEAF